MGEGFIVSCGDCGSKNITINITSSVELLIKCNEKDCENKDTVEC